MTTSNQRIVLAKRPEGRPQPSDFRLETLAVPTPQQGEVLLKIHYLSLDPYMRGRMSAARSYAQPLEVGDLMVGATVAEVVESRLDGYSAGDWVLSYSGWQRYACSNGRDLRRLDDSVPLTTALGVLGMPGFTAYAGLFNIGKPKAGETLVVAAASGPVGATVGQLAKREGLRTVGIAGGERKRRLLTEKFGFDVALDHRAADFAEQLAKACPSGIDIYFENVGGKVWDAVLPLLNEFARIPVCGLAAQYNGVSGEQADRLPGMMREVLSRSLTIRGFIQREYFPTQFGKFLELAGPMVASGELSYLEDIVEGLDSAPEAFIGLLEGANLGKLIIHL